MAQNQQYSNERDISTYHLCEERRELNDAFKNMENPQRPAIRTQPQYDPLTHKSPEQCWIANIINQTCENAIHHCDFPTRWIAVCASRILLYAMQFAHLSNIFAALRHDDIISQFYHSRNTHTVCICKWNEGSCGQVHFYVQKVKGIPFISLSFCLSFCAIVDGNVNVLSSRHYTKRKHNNHCSLVHKNDFRIVNYQHNGYERKFHFNIWRCM